MTDFEVSNFLREMADMIEGCEVYSLDVDNSREVVVDEEQSKIKDFIVYKSGGIETLKFKLSYKHA